jgi:hypothetical protein
MSQYYSFLVFVLLICGCEKVKMPTCGQDNAQVCITNTRNTVIYGTFLSNLSNDTIAPNQRKCFTMKVNEFVTFKVSSGTRYSWPLKECQEEYPIF